jgi:hypothetical protein
MRSSISTPAVGRHGARRISEPANMQTPGRQAGRRAQDRCGRCEPFCHSPVAGCVVAGWMCGTYSLHRQDRTGE